MRYSICIRVEWTIWSITRNFKIYSICVRVEWTMEYNKKF